MKRFFSKIRKLITFIPVVWKHEDWDYAYIDIFNEFLHKRLYECVFVNGHGIMSKKHKKSIETIILLYNRIGEDSYDDKRIKEMQNIFGDDCFTSIFLDSDVNGFRRYISKNSMYSEQRQKEFRNKLLELGKHAEYSKKQDRALLHKLISRHSKHFWD